MIGSAPPFSRIARTRAAAFSATVVPVLNLRLRTFSRSVASTVVREKSAPCGHDRDHESTYPSHTASGVLRLSAWATIRSRRIGRR